MHDSFESRTQRKYCIVSTLNVLRGLISYENKKNVSTMFLRMISNDIKRLFLYLFKGYVANICQ